MRKSGSEYSLKYRLKKVDEAYDRWVEACIHYGLRPGEEDLLTAQRRFDSLKATDPAARPRGPTEQ